MVVTVFRSRLRESEREAYTEAAATMAVLAASMPGFVAIKDFVAPDGERVAIVEFDSERNHAAWRDHPEHQRTQAAGRERYFSEYKLQVCSLMHERSFVRDGD